MSYLVLARKWRPRSFDTLIGQDHVVRALTHALSSGRLHHAWLFTGTRGVGKTTLSRILAKSLNSAEGVTATPCGHCQACTEIDAGRYVDYIELDAASNRGVDEMTQLLEQAVYAPSVGRYKVYMIDEVHMLTGHAFNAMLKTLEEPPEHVKFILATTDPQKIPVTVLSRCLQFNLKQMTVPAIVEHLRHVLSEESIPAETQGLRLIAQAAAGSMRDALSLTDQAISYSAGDLTAAAVGEMLGTLDQHHLVHLLRALTAGDAAAVVAVADDLALRGLSFQSALADMAVMLSRVAIAQRLGHAPPDDPLASDIEALASALAPDETQLFYTVAVHSRRELSLAPDEYAGFVMACLRMLALLPADRVPPVIAEPSPSVAAEAPLAPVASAAPAGAMAGPGTEPARGVGATVRTDADIAPPASLDVPDAVEAMAEEVGDWTQDVPEPTEDFDLPVSSAVNDMDPVPVLSTLSPAPRRVDIETPDPARMTAADWPALAASLPVGGAARALAVNSEWLAGDERRIRLRVAIHSLVESSSQDRLRTVLSEHFGRVLRLDVEYGDTGEDTAYAVDQAERGRRRQAAEEAVAQDPLVQALVREFAARVVPGSVQPPGRMP
jgi:DNA polymerase-3 subunit gamma/tau